MGDRTYVTLQVPEECRDDVMAIAEASSEGGPWDEWESAIKGLIVLGFEEVNNGELAFLKDLRNFGIPYDSDWAAGDEYLGGVEYCRFTSNGDLALKTVHEGTAPVLETLLEMLEKPEALKIITKYLHDFKEQVTPLPWDNQIEYGKIHRTKRLITAT